jgi:hypothetical protein
LNQSGVREIVPSVPGFEFRSVWEETRFSDRRLEWFSNVAARRASN